MHKEIKGKWLGNPNNDPIPNAGRYFDTYRWKYNNAQLVLSNSPGGCGMVSMSGWYMGDYNENFRHLITSLQEFMVNFESNNILKPNVDDFNFPMNYVGRIICQVGKSFTNVETSLELCKFELISKEDNPHHDGDYTQALYHWSPRMGYNDKWLLKDA